MATLDETFEFMGWLWMKLGNGSVVHTSEGVETHKMKVWMDEG